MAVKANPQRIIVLCDGTWCGRETGTQSNIWKLAEAFGIDLSGGKNDTVNTHLNFRARYFQGSGTGKPFLYYLFDGVTGSDLRDKCVEAYQYVAENYVPESQIWMFGLSRGAFTVRCVAGMINNCGIVKPSQERGAVSQLQAAFETKFLCEEVYRIYRSPYEEDKPNTPKMKAFRDKWSYSEVENPTQPPVKFMGLIDTVGSLGIPRLNPGMYAGGEWPEFHDQKVSSVVEKVYHAMSLHDRLWIFQPCRASRTDTLLRRITDNPASRSRVAGKQPDYQIYERWFPGCHYDLGRQQFEFLREGSGNGVNIFERVSSFLSSPISRSVIPNKSSADAVLRWLLEKVDEESGNPTFDRMQSLVGFDNEVNNTRKNPQVLSAQSLSECSGDIYDQLELYAPGAKLLPSGLLSWASLLFPGSNEFSKIALATRDRRVSCMSSSASDGVTLTTVEDYKSSLSANDLSAFRQKYPSKTFELHEAYCPNHQAGNGSTQ
ncbi:hypothetical protein KC332_g12972 [Hortaea werneckii]|uniref:T6SS Phospholipase effector Tle1-like catalytic domain-containing protein n=1 Tax=Hortaea werneckii TaxID=91943 RepID=A0A3M7GQA8_HORWE|nr:hypothetical protein KC350_g12611 [Hortaea werneckii]KAI6970972.1 hypothetical protein KC329_g13195 [Hortaea werneckii]KAI7021585.1 hypothetical protein KC366_g13318 [Hortaea werneckii]KAI7063378.1 hypothetical protein KC327_g12890 [Hortaea werneckii]KAI7121315.1 hypothetical protein KC337_g13312 [Hortaea werneckii]